MNFGASCLHSSTPQGCPAIGNEPNDHFQMREFGTKTVVKRVFIILRVALAALTECTALPK